MKLSTSYKIVFLSLLLILSGVTAFPHKSHAQFGLGLNTAMLVAKEYAIDTALNVVAKNMLQSATKSVVNWINTGFQGSPAFVQDLNKELLQVGDAQAERFIQEFTNSGELANVPWKDEIAQTVLANYFRNTSRDGFALNNPYTLDRVSSDPEAFIRGDYTKGGLDAWMSVVLNPGNNPLALFQNTENELRNRVSGAQGKKLTELGWAKGTNSYRGNCTQTRTVNGVPVLSFTGGGTSAPSDLLAGTPYAAASASSTPTDLNAGSKDCSNQPILTPGALIADAMTKYAVDNGADQLIAADEMQEVIGALINQLVGNVLGGKGGLAGTKISDPSSGTDSSGAGQIPVGGTAGTGGATSATGSSDQFLGIITSQQTQIQQYQTDWTTIETAALSARAALSGTCPLVESTITQAFTMKENATNAINALTSIRTQIETAASQDPTTQLQTISDATTQYQQILSYPSFPTLTDIQVARGESQPRQASAGTSASLYTKMVDISTNRTCST